MIESNGVGKLDANVPTLIFTSQSSFSSMLPIYLRPII